MGFGPAPFCAAPIPSQKRRLPILGSSQSTGGGRVCAPDGLYQQRSLGTNTSPGLDPRLASCPSCSGRPQHRREEISHEGLVSHRFAVRSRDLRSDPDLATGNIAWHGVERRSSASCHVPACPCDGASGRKTRVSAGATCSPPRLLILFGIVKLICSCGLPDPPFSHSVRHRGRERKTASGGGIRKSITRQGCRPVQPTSRTICSPAGVRARRRPRRVETTRRTYRLG
jgi:hypothetical protein